MDGWDTGLEFVEKCSEVDGNFLLILEPLVMEKIHILMEEKDGIEWLAYYVGKIHWDKKYIFVDDLYIPDSQEVDMASVENINNDMDRNNIIGVIHSHHSMPCVFSKTDWEYLNKNNDVSTVVSNGQDEIEFNTVVRVKTPCGKMMHINVEEAVNYRIMDIDERRDFIDSINKKIIRGIEEYPNTYESVFFESEDERDINEFEFLEEEYLDRLYEGYYQ